MLLKLIEVRKDAIEKTHQEPVADETFFLSEKVSKLGSNNN